MDMSVEIFFLWWYGFFVLDMKKKFVSNMDKFWLDIGEFLLDMRFWLEQKFLDIEEFFLLGMGFWLEQIFGHGKIFVRYGIFFVCLFLFVCFCLFVLFCFLFLFWNDYFVDISMIGQLRFAEPQELR